MNRPLRIDSRRAHRPAGRAVELTERFYDWEKRGRGWKLWDRRVELEPPFKSFISHSPSRSTGSVDDGQKPPVLGQLARAVSQGLRPTSRIAPSRGPETAREPAPGASPSPGRVVEHQIAVPPTLKVRRGAAENLLISLSHSGDLIAFEIVGTEDEVYVQFVTRNADRAHLAHQVTAHFPESALIEHSRYLEERWRTGASQEGLIVEFGLSHEFMLPIRVAPTLEPDPLVSVVGTLADLGPGEVGVYQVLFQATRNPWCGSVLRSVSDAEGKAFFGNAPDVLKLAKQKVSRPLFAVVVRAAATSPIPDRSREIVRSLAAGLRQFSSPSHNEFIPLRNDGYTDIDHGNDLLARATRRSGMLLNSEELASLAHPPSASVQCSKMLRKISKTRAAPAIVTGHRLVIGDNNHAGRTIECTLSEDQRVRHEFMVGATGTGKTVTICNKILQDIGVVSEPQKPAVMVLEAHGDLIDQVLARIPEERHDDVTLVDLSDDSYSVGLNVLNAATELQKNLLNSDFVANLRRYSTSWGDQMTAVLSNGVSAFVESDQPGTLLDLKRFLIDPAFRKSFLKTVRDPQVVYFWEKEFPLLVGKAGTRPQTSLLTRLDAFLRPKAIRHMVGQRSNQLDFSRIMNEGKILLVKLAQGLIGAENSYLLGTFFVSQIHQQAMSRQAIEESQRRYAFLYIDEAHNFLTPSMAHLLSAVRKYRLGLVLASQDPKQFARDPEVLNSVLSNPFTRICYRLGDEAAKSLQASFAHFDAHDLQNLGVGEAICRVERADYDFNLKTRPLAPVDPDVAQRRRERIAELSRRKYATPVSEVEKAIRASLGDETGSISVDRRSGASSTSPPPTPPTLGRGGKQHRYIQQLIKRGAERLGYRAVIERQILSGMGSVDVALEQGGKSIACEVSTTSTPAQELGNIRKCLAAGIRLIVSVAAEEARLFEIEAEASAHLEADEIDRVRFLTPEKLLALLKEMSEQDRAAADRTRGYRVQVERTSVGEEERHGRTDLLVRLVHRVALRGCSAREEGS